MTEGFYAVTASTGPIPGKSYMLPWSIEMLYEIEPKLKKLADEALAAKTSKSHDVRRAAYVKARNESFELVGIGARDPRLRSGGAYDCFTEYILERLKLPYFKKSPLY